MSLMTIKNIIQETPDCVSIFFEGGEEHTFKAGQYVTVIAEINGEKIRRSYSICTATYAQDFGIAVKKIKGGKMSTYLNDVVKIGDELEVTKPEGSFVLKAKETSHRDHYFVAAGSGITPVISMIKEVLEKEPQSYCYLYYGSRDENHIIFDAELKSLESKYSGQLTVLRTLSQPIQEKGNGLLGFLKKKITWRGETGRIDLGKFINFLELYPARADEQHYYFCGPAEIIQMGERLLKERSVEDKYIHKEYFEIPDDLKKEIDGSSATLIAYHRGEVLEIAIDKGQTVLDAMIAADADPEYSCTTGACSSCVAKIKNGTAEMAVCFGLDPDEIEDGYILTCQAKPTSAKLEIEYIDHESTSGWT